MSTPHVDETADRTKVDGQHADPPERKIEARGGAIAEVEGEEEEEIDTREDLHDADDDDGAKTRRWTPRWTEDEFREWVEDHISKKLSTKLTWMTVATGVGILALLMSVAGLITKLGQDYIVAKNESVKADTHTAVEQSKATLVSDIASKHAGVLSVLDERTRALETKLGQTRDALDLKLDDTRTQLEDLVDDKIDAEIAHALVFQQPVLDVLTDAAKSAAGSEQVRQLMSNEALTVARSDDVHQAICSGVGTAITADLPVRVQSALNDPKFHTQIVNIAEKELREKGSIQGIVREQLQHSYDTASDDFERVLPLQMLIIFEDVPGKLDDLLVRELERPQPEDGECFEIALAAYRCAGDDALDRRARSAALKYLASARGFDRPQAFVQFFAQLSGALLSDLGPELTKLADEDAVDVVLSGVVRNTHEEALELLARLAAPEAGPPSSSHVNLQRRACAALAGADSRCWSAADAVRNNAIRTLVSTHQDRLESWLMPQPSKDFAANVFDALKHRDVAWLERLREETRKGGHHEYDEFFEILFDDPSGPAERHERIDMAVEYFATPDVIREWVKRGRFFDGEVADAARGGVFEQMIFDAVVRLLRLHRLEEMQPDFGWILLPIADEQESNWREAELYAALWTARIQLEHDAGQPVESACNSLLDQIAGDPRALVRPGYRRTLRIVLEYADRAHVQSCLDRFANVLTDVAASKASVDDSFADVLGAALRRDCGSASVPAAYATEFLERAAATRGERAAQVRVHDLVLASLAKTFEQAVGARGGDAASVALTGALERWKPTPQRDARLALAVIDILLQAPVERRHELVLAVEASAMPSLAETLPAGASDEELKRAADIDRRIAELLPWRAAAPTANARLSAAESVEPVSVRLAGEGDRYAWIELQGSNERAVELRAIGTAAQVTLLSEDRRKVLDSFELQSGQKRSLRPLGGGSGLLRVHVDTPCSDDCAVELRAFARPRHTDFGADATVAPTLAPGRYVIEVKPEWTWAKFAAQEGKTYELRTAAADRSNAGAESEIDTELIVRTFPGDRRVAGNDDDDDAGMDTYYSKIRWKCPASGEYVVGVRRLEGGSRLDSLCEFSVAESAP